MDEYLTTKEIASFLKINVLTVRRWIMSKKLQAVLLGKEYRIKKSDLDTFLDDRKVNKS